MDSIVRRTTRKNLHAALDAVAKVMGLTVTWNWVSEQAAIMRGTDISEFVSDSDLAYCDKQDRWLQQWLDANHADYIRCLEVIVAANDGKPVGQKELVAAMGDVNI